MKSEAASQNFDSTDAGRCMHGDRRVLEEKTPIYRLTCIFILNCNVRGRSKLVLERQVVCLVLNGPRATPKTEIAREMSR